MAKENIADNSHFCLTADASGEEITSLLETFWGKGNKVAYYRDNIIGFQSALKILEKASSLDTKTRDALITQELANKVITVGVRFNDTLVAHGALLVQPWREVEITGSITHSDFRSKGLMGKVNMIRKQLLTYFAQTRYRLTSYSIVGSASVEYEHHLLEIPEYSLNPYFSNFGPYVYRRHIDNPLQEPGRLKEASAVLGDEMVSSSVQVIAIDKTKPPYANVKTIRYAPPVFRELLSAFPNAVEENAEQSVSGNTLHTSLARIDIHTLTVPLENDKLFIAGIHSEALNDKSIIIRIPLKPGSSEVLEQIGSIANQEYGEFILIPTGLTVVDGYWACCFSFMPTAFISHFSFVLQSLTKIYQGSLKNLSEILLRHIHNERRDI